MGWGEAILALFGFAFLALGAATLGEWLICGLDEIGARFRIPPRRREEECGCNCDALDDGAPPFGSPEWVRQRRENEE